MNILTLPWCIICATLAQTSAIVITALAIVRYLIYHIYIVVTGKDRVRQEMAIGIMTYIPLLAIVFGAYTSKHHLVGFRNPICCIFGPISAAKTIGDRATEIYEVYLGMKHTGKLKQNEMHGLNGFFKWLNNHKEIWKDLILAPHRS